MDEPKLQLSHILIIDDEDKIRTLLTKIISLEGFEVLQAVDCKSAMKKLEHTDIDVILSDVKLPDGNGVALIKQKSCRKRFTTISTTTN